MATSGARARRKTSARKVTSERVAGQRAGRLEDDVDKPVRPLDPWPGDPPKKDWGDFRQFVVDIDWSVNLTDEAISRIERQLRQAVYAELAEGGSDVLIRSLRYRGAHGIEVIGQ